MASVYQQLFDIVTVLAVQRGHLEAIIGGPISPDHEDPLATKTVASTVDEANSRSKPDQLTANQAPVTVRVAFIALMGSVFVAISTVVAKSIHDPLPPVDCVAYMSHLQTLERDYPGVGHSQLFQRPRAVVAYGRQERTCGDPGAILRGLEQTKAG